MATAAAATARVIWAVPQFIAIIEGKTMEKYDQPSNLSFHTNPNESSSCKIAGQSMNIQ
jgi:hypothetical protein